MLIAYRYGHHGEELIPLDFRERYARAGYLFREAPSHLPRVLVPTPLSVVVLASEAGPIGPGPVSEASPENRTRRRSR
jgi:hypothetical protein